jgi:hypothetical protein
MISDMPSLERIDLSIWHQERALQLKSDLYIMYRAVNKRSRPLSTRSTSYPFILDKEQQIKFICMEPCMRATDSMLPHSIVTNQRDRNYEVILFIRGTFIV